MTDAVLSVNFAGPLVSVQDAGRAGLMRYGVPASGPMDRRAFAAANLALGNALGAPAIEVSLGGLALTCLAGQVSFAVAGGGFLLDHAGVRRGSWSMATLNAGDKLVIRPGHWGAWCYLAFAGDLQADGWLGSVATHALSGFGGGKLAAGQVWTIANAETRHGCDGAIPCPVSARPRHSLRVTLGPQDRFFTADTIDAFLSGPWKISDAYDRMGIRLSGPNVAPDAVLTMPSEPVLRGSVQVAGDGVASVLMADHQTTGGYPKLATVLDCDLDAMAQLRPRDALRFQAVTPGDAIQIARRSIRADQRYLQGLLNRH